jgi:hypothetical protein
VLDKERLKNGAFLSQKYYDNLLAEIREIRASERRFYQKITDIYATAMDYSAEAATTQTFFATVQNKLHFAIHGHTAAELIVNRADSKKERMGLSSTNSSTSASQPTTSGSCRFWTITTQPGAKLAPSSTRSPWPLKAGESSPMGGKLRLGRLLAAGRHFLAGVGHRAGDLGAKTGLGGSLG